MSLMLTSSKPFSRVWSKDKRGEKSPLFIPLIYIRVRAYNKNKSNFQKKFDKKSKQNTTYNLGEEQSNPSKVPIVIWYAST